MIVWILCLTLNLASKLVMAALGRVTLNRFRFFYDLVMILVFLASIACKLMGFYLLADMEQYGHGYVRPLSIGANMYGVAACMAFLKVIEDS